MTMALSAASIKNLSTGKHSDGGGLILEVTATGSKRFILRYQLNKRRRDMALGKFPDISLSDARKLRDKAKAQIAQGIDPIEARKAERAAASQDAAPPFKQLAEQFISAQEPGWSNPKQAAQWRSSLAAYAFPFIGNKTADQITYSDVLDLLKNIWTSKPETASRVRQRIERVLNYAAAHGHRDRSQPNPAQWRGNLDAALPPHRKIQPVQHFPALPHKDAPAFWSWLAGKQSMSAQALKWTILTTCRTNEVLGARWDEVDLQERVWRIPAERMKARKPHAVPLSEQAVQLLESIPRTGSEYLFPGRKGPMSNMAMLVFLKKNDHKGMTPHGWRSTFRDWSADRTSFGHDTCEQALAHTVRNAAEAAYRRGEQLEKRRHLMQAWADYLEGKPFQTTPDFEQAQAGADQLTELVGNMNEDERQRLLALLQASA